MLYEVITNLVKMINQIIPRLVKQQIDIEFFHINITGSGVKSYLSIQNYEKFNEMA